MRTVPPTSGSYAIQSPERIHVGPGVVSELSEFVATEDISRALIVTDRGVREAGVLEPVQAALTASDVSFSIYDGVEPEPKLRMAAEAADRITTEETPLVVGVGGGSSLDVAKFASVLAAHDTPIRDLLGMQNVRGPGGPVALVPTTAGTGSEVTHIGVFADEQDDGAKKVVYSPHLFSDISLIDPTLTATLPAAVAAETGMDALTHAIEAYVTRLRNPYTDLLAQGAIELIGENLRDAVHNGPTNEGARHAMSLAAMLGGKAFVNSGLGAVHALTYPLGMQCDLGHGRANAILLPYVMAYNVPSEPKRFADIARWLGVEPKSKESESDLAQRGVDRIFALLDDVDIPTTIDQFAELGQDDFESFADIALEHSAHNLDRNPRPMDRSDIITVFEAAYSGTRP